MKITPKIALFKSVSCMSFVVLVCFIFVFDDFGWFGGSDSSTWGVSAFLVDSLRCSAFLVFLAKEVAFSESESAADFAKLTD